MKASRLSGKAMALLFIATCCLTFCFAQDSKKNKQAQKETEIKNLIDSQNFVFKAETVYPLGGRSRQLTTEYDLKVSKAAVVSYLPYFGRAYSATPGSTGAYDFTSKNFEYSVKENKKGGWDIAIKPKDSRQARQLSLAVFKNGTANLQITSDDRQSISYYGYVAATPQKK